MNILILGGTVFVGRGVAEAALARGHSVTLFHRGTKGVGIVEGAEDMLGDRDGGLETLEGCRWDAVVDACGYVPRIVGASAQALRAAAQRYLFVSTISVYEDDGADGVRVRAVEKPVGTEEIDGETYGPLKVECERAVLDAWGDAATLVRPGLVYGPHDPTNRFPHWVRRFLEGGEILVPDVLDAPLQQIDARDLGAFVVRLLEDDRAGTFDVVGEDSTFGATIDACQALNLAAQPVYAGLDALAALGLKPGGDLPLAYPQRSALMSLRPEAALAAGLECRPLRDTAEDTAAWVRATPVAESPSFGLSREREIEALRRLGASAKPVL